MIRFALSSSSFDMRVIFLSVNSVHDIRLY